MLKEFTLSCQECRFSIRQGHVDSHSESTAVFKVNDQIDRFDQFLVLVEDETVDFKTADGWSLCPHFNVVNLPSNK